MIEVSCAIIIEKNRVLATRRSESMPHPLKWEFPGGKLKSGESPKASIVREIREELGLEVDPQRLLTPVVHHYDSQSVKLIPVVCGIVDGLIKLAEHQEYRWVACDSLEELDWLEADIGVVEKIKEELCNK
jgi:8-oxo-dGTP diphosphatase